MLVTSNLHPESSEALDYEVVLLGRPIPYADWGAIAKTYRHAAAFRPDVVVTEFIRDPRWRTLARLAPRVRLLHDDVPHDPTHRPPWWNRLFFERWDQRADATVVFSEYVADSLLRRQLVSRPQLHVAPLTSDLPLSMVPPFVPAQERRNIVLVGRQRPYKNYEVVFAAWEMHTRGLSWPGDELVLIGDGDIAHPLPAHTRWAKEAFKYERVVDEIAHARASLIHSREASQSGVQVMSLQLGVPTLVSTAGGLPEYQPGALPPIGVNDAEGLSRAMDGLTSPQHVEVQASQALQLFRSKFEPSVAAARLLEILEVVAQEGK